MKQKSSKILSRNKNDSRGFTLVELSIVMIIVGLLIGGVLKGSELIDNARVKKTVAELNNIHSAVNTFRDTYGGLPGDITNATTVVPNCDGTSFCANGDGNSLIAGVSGVDSYFWTSPVIGFSVWAPESIQFWKQLALANLIDGVASYADPAAPAFGVTHPAADVGGGFEFYFDGATTLMPDGAQILRLSSDSAIKGTPFETTITASQAEKIDRIMDDGVPNTGDIMANYGNLADDCKDGGPINTSPSSYKTTGPGRACTLFFRFFKNN